MALEPHPSGLCHSQERRAADRHAATDLADESKTMAGPRRRSRQPGQPSTLGADIGSFRLHLAAEGKAARTVLGYTSAVRWFAAGYLLGQPGKTSWEQVDAQDIQRAGSTTHTLPAEYAWLHVGSLAVRCARITAASAG